MSSPRIRIAYLTNNDPLDKTSWSGITYYLGQALQRNVGDVDFLGPVPLPWFLEKSFRAFAKLNRILFKKEYAVKYSLVYSWYCTRYLKKKMKGKQYDCAVAPSVSVVMGTFTADIPIVYVADTTFELYSNYYPREFKDISPISLREGEYLEKKSLEHSSLVVYCSNWAANSAMKHYGLPREKWVLHPLGANMDRIPDRDMIFEREKNETLTLLFLAVDWDRKGGALALDTLRHLNKMGYGARLIVCGCIPPEGISDPNMDVIPFLNKNIKAEHDLFTQLLCTSHFLILPTRADCSLLVACESNAYGMPAISTDTGGVADTVVYGVNGYCLPHEAPGSAYAELIAEIYHDKPRYHELIRTSRAQFEERLNWDQWAERFKEWYRELRKV